jgi:diketogulonate reductase-like aldo/keto reductase
MQEFAMIPTKRLNSGVDMPVIGLGVWKASDEEAEAAVAAAIKAGYTSIDTASVYRNERGVGRGIARAGVARRDLFVTTKVWNDNQGYDATLKAFDASVAKLGLDYVDLYLIHWPAASKGLYAETWKALETLNRDGRARSIGVSNFLVPHLERLFQESDVKPALNQIELHPTMQQPELRAFHAKHGIATEAWSPLAQGAVEIAAIATIARRLGRTPAQVILRWHVQLGNIAIPKSVTPSRIAENIDVFGFELSDADMAAIARLDAGNRIGPHPDRMN